MLVCCWLAIVLVNCFWLVLGGWVWVVVLAVLGVLFWIGFCLVCRYVIFLFCLGGLDWFGAYGLGFAICYLGQVGFCVV